MIDLYDGTLGLKHNKDAIVKQLTEYIIRSDEDLSYGILEKQTKVVIITGKNDLENKIPTFYHPVIFEFRNTKYVAMDMRLFVSKPKDEITNITNILKDKNNGKIALARLIITKMFLDDDLRFLLAINKSVLDMFANIVTTIYRNITMDMGIIPIVNLSCNYHYLTFENSSPISAITFIQNIDQKIRQNVSITNPNLINNFKEDIEKEYLPNPSVLLGDLIDVISVVGEGTRATKVTSDIFLASISRTFFALNSAELSIAMIESKANLIGILYGVMSNSLQKKSILYKTIDFGKRYNGLREFLSVMDRTFTEQLSL